MRVFRLLRVPARALITHLPRHHCAAPAPSVSSSSNLLSQRPTLSFSQPRVVGPTIVRPPHNLFVSSRSCSITFSARSSHAQSSRVAMSTEAGAEAEVVGVRKGTAALAVLNRPKALNALNHNMVDLLQGFFEDWEKDPNVNLVIVKSDGKGFCSGGDVRTCVQAGSNGNWLEGAEFFRKEYVLDYLVATYKKPYVALINGVCMGGGNGISMHAPFRVVTEKALWAMPETLIGLHPDVGASYFLPRLPGFLGEYLALTGQRLKAADLLSTGLATHVVSSERLPALEDRLCSLRVPDLESVKLAINEFADLPHPAELKVVTKQALIDKSFQHSTVEEILAALEAGSSSSDAAEAEWSAETLATLRKMSPTSLKVSLRSVREGRNQTLAECLEKETRLSFRCMEKTTSHDFYEGVRALLIDKDNNPKFSPATLADVTPEMLDLQFSSLRDPAHEFPLAALLKSRGQ